jgi:hypothetical protein
MIAGGRIVQVESSAAPAQAVFWVPSRAANPNHHASRRPAARIPLSTVPARLALAFGLALAVSDEMIADAISACVSAEVPSIGHVTGTNRKEETVALSADRSESPPDLGFSPWSG